MPVQKKLAVALLGALGVMLAASAANAMSAQDFVTKASVANKFEIESSKLALDKSQNSDVKNFAQQMVEDHDKTGEKLKDTIKDANINVTPAPALDSKHQKIMAKLEKLNGQDFDKKYISVQTDAHKEAVSLFSTYATKGKQPALKDFAAQTLPTLQEHLQHVKELKKAE